MARHLEITAAPGTNEQRERAAAAALPESTDLSVRTRRDLARVAFELRQRPRVTLDGRTPQDCSPHSPISRPPVAEVADDLARDWRLWICRTATAVRSTRCCPTRCCPTPCGRRPGERRGPRPSLERRRHPVSAFARLVDRTRDDAAHQATLCGIAAIRPVEPSQWIAAAIELFTGSSGYSAVPVHRPRDRTKLPRRSPRVAPRGTPPQSHLRSGHHYHRRNHAVRQAPNSRAA